MGGRWIGNARQDRDDCNDNHQLDQGEPSHLCLHRGCAFDLQSFGTSSRQFTRPVGPPGGAPSSELLVLPSPQFSTANTPVPMVASPPVTFTSVRMPPMSTPQPRIPTFPPASATVTPSPQYPHNPPLV